LALLHLDRHEEAEAIEIAREVTQPDALTLGVRGTALRIANAPNLAAGHYEEIITGYLTDYPELRDGKVLIEVHGLREVLNVTLDLASVYLQAGEEAKAESLLSAAESEIPHWHRHRHGFGGMASQMSISTPCGVKKRKLWRLSARAWQTERDSCGGCNSSTTQT
jgi:hypothetical protein